MQSARVSIAANLTAARDLVGNVFGLGSGLQMIVTTATRVVAAVAQKSW